MSKIETSQESNVGNASSEGSAWIGVAQGRMKYRFLGSSGLKVSELGLGGMTLSLNGKG